jgi:hypothetical protein
MVAAMRNKDRKAREKELDKIDSEHKALYKKIKDKGEYAYLLAGKDDPKKAGKLMGEVLISLFHPATRKVQSRYEQAEQRQRNLHIAFALAAYHSDKGSYPAKLDDLAPKYLTTIPGDLFFSDKPLTYRPLEKGYLLYSVGVNGIDEAGRTSDDDPPGDDIRVRMPLPELKQKK